MLVGAYAAPANLNGHLKHFQIPITSRLTEFFPHDWQMYFLCWDSSNPFMVFLKVDPYLHPYFPTIPAFFVFRDMGVNFEKIFQLFGDVSYFSYSLGVVIRFDILKKMCFVLF